MIIFVAMNNIVELHIELINAASAKVLNQRTAINSELR